MPMRTLFARLIAAWVLMSTGSLAVADELNIYSARKEALIKPLLDRFEAESGIKVNLVTGKADALLQRLQSEGRNTPADLLITVDAGRLYRAKRADLLQPVRTDALTDAIPDAYRDPEGYWYGLSLRARPIMYVKGKVDPGELSTYEALAHPKWKGRICIRSSDNVYNQSLVASMIAALGEQATEAWAKALVSNFARDPKGGDRDQIAAAAAGQCDIAIANTYYLGQMLSSSDSDQKAAAEKVLIFWPNQDDRGTHVNVGGAGVTKASKNRANAIKLLEYLAGDGAQQWYAEVNNEYPVKPDVAWSSTVGSWGDFKADSLNLGVLGDNNAAAVKLMDRAGWQ